MLRKHHLSIKNAYKGMKWALRTQQNYRIHLFLSFIALLLCFVLSVSYTEFLVILMLIFIGVMVECMNTAIELTTDAIDKNWREDIGLAKDVAAGAMLLFSLGAAIISGIIFLPKILLLISNY